MINFISSSIAIGTVVVLLCSMLGAADVIGKNYKAGTLSSEAFLSRYKNLTEGLRIEGSLARYWTIVTLTRWALLCIVLVILRGYYAFQILLLLM